MKLSTKVLIIVFAASLQAGASTRLLKGKDSPPVARELQQNKNGGGGGGKGGGGTPTDPPSDGDPPSDVTPDYGDLVRLLRFPSTGVPILTPVETGMQCEWANVTRGCCLWPLASEDPECDACAVDVTCTTTGDCDVVDTGEGIRVINSTMIDPLSCSVAVTCANCTMETDFGRTSSTRAPESVFDQSFLEAMTVLKSSVCELYQDPAGRLGHFANTDVEDPEEFTLDSPLNNMALYREIMRTGKLTDLEDELFPPGPRPSATDIELAPAFFGAAFDKSGSINMDTIIYTNAILELPETSVFDKVCIWIRGEEMGEIAAREKCFIDYSQLAYSHDRNAKFGVSGSLPNPPYVPEAPEETPMPGEFEILENITGECLDPAETYFQKVHRNIYSKVFGIAHGHQTGDAAAMFAQAADDTRAVIYHMHSWPVPADYASKRVCTQYEHTIYNLYIASLQVPINIVVGAEDRELFVTVGNSGRDAAPVVTLEVKGTMVAGTTTTTAILGYNGTTALGISYLEVDKAETFSLNPGASKTFTGFVPGDLTGGGVGSIIEWTATISAPSGEDYPLVDNEMTDITTVVSSGGKKSSSHLRAL